MEILTKEFKRIGVIDKGFAFIEKNYITKQFSDACGLNESLNTFYELEETTQVGVQLTAQISHSFYCYMKYHLNELFIKSNSFLRVITKKKREVVVGEKKEMSYDLILKDINTGEEYFIEVKLSQNQNSWQGSTSTTSKVDTFLMINFKIDRDKPLTLNDNSNLFTGLFATIVNMKNKKWTGVAKDNAHRTKFDFRLNEWDLDILRKESNIKGDFIPKKAIAHLALDPINYGDN